MVSFQLLCRRTALLHRLIRHSGGGELRTTFPDKRFFYSIEVKHGEEEEEEEEGVAERMLCP